MSSSKSATESQTTPPPGAQERALQAIATQAARLGLPELRLNADLAAGAFGLPFDRTQFNNLTREELGLRPSSINTEQKPNERDRILAGYRDRVERLKALAQQRGMPLNTATFDDLQPQGSEVIALREEQEEQAAQQRFIADAEGRFTQTQQTPLARLIQQEIAQEQRLLPFRQSAEQAQLNQVLRESTLGEQAAREIGPIQLDLARREAGLGISQFEQLTGAETEAARRNLGLAGQQDPNVQAAVQRALQLAQAGSPDAQAAVQRALQLAQAGSPDAQAAVQEALRLARGQENPEDVARLREISQSEFDIARSRLAESGRLATRGILEDFAGRRGLRGDILVNNPTFEELGRNIQTQLGQLASAQAGTVAQQRLALPFQRGSALLQGAEGLSNLSLQQQAALLQGAQSGQGLSLSQQAALLQAAQSGQGLTLQQSQALSQAIQTSQALRLRQPSAFPRGTLSEGSQLNLAGQNPFGAFQLPFSLQSQVLQGSPFAVNAQQPLLQSRLSNITGTRTQRESGLGQISALLSGTGSLLQGAGSLVPRGGGGGGSTSSRGSSSSSSK